MATRFPASRGVDFAITGVGLFCSDSLDVVFDDFIAAEGTTGACPIIPPTFSGMHRARQNASIANTDLRLFDLSGRLITGSRTATGAATKASGLYIRRNGSMLYRQNAR